MGGGRRKGRWRGGGWEGLMGGGGGGREGLRGGEGSGGREGSNKEGEGSGLRGTVAW